MISIGGKDHLVMYDSIADPSRFPKTSRYSEFVPRVLIPIVVLDLGSRHGVEEIVCEYEGRTNSKQLVAIRMFIYM